MSGAIPTVLVKADNDRGFRRINKDKYDADPNAFELVDGETVLPPKKGNEDVQRALDFEEGKRKADANRGVIPDGIDATGAGRNTSGTYGEPTPTDIRYPDKSKTEFENNAGAFLGRSAAGLRKEEGIEDAPGGLDPEDHRRKLKAERQRKRRQLQDEKKARAEQAEATMGTRLSEVRSENADEVEIPENWEEMPWRDQVKLAQEIQGDDAKLTKSEAQDVIRAELDRRENDDEADSAEGEAEETTD